MMNNLISPNFQKMLAILLLIVAALTIFNVLLMPVYNVFMERRENVELLENRVNNYQKIIAQKDYFEEQLTAIRNTPMPDLLYQGDSAVNLNSQVQSDVRNLINSAGARIENMQSIALKPEDGIENVGLRMVLNMEMEALVRVLSAFENHAKLLYFDNVSLKVPENQNDKIAPQLTVRWDIYGFGILTSPEILEEEPI